MNQIHKVTGLTVALCIVSTLAFVSPSFGGMVMYDTPYNEALSPAATNLLLPKFDPSFGTLTSVKLLITTTTQASVTAENDSINPANTFGVILSGFSNITGPDSTFAQANIFKLSPTVGVTATDSVSGSGPDFHDFGSISDTSSATANVDAANFGLYTGTGNFALSFFALGAFSVTGTGDSTVKTTNMITSGTAKVTYEYDEVTAVPEPSAYALVIAGVGLLSLHRRRRS